MVIDHPDVQEKRLPEAAEDRIAQYVRGLLGTPTYESGGNMSIDDGQIAAHARWRLDRQDEASVRVAA